MSAVEKAEVLTKVASSGLPKGRVLRELGVPRSTYYRWLRRKEQQGLEDDVGGGNPPWNRLTSQEADCVLSAAREMPELSPRQLAAWTTDNQGFSVSESTVYRILRREGLVKRAEMQLAAGKEYHRKTTGSHQMWATDTSYFRVVGWGRVPGSGVRGRGSGERETTASSLAGKEESSRKEDNSGQGKDGPAGAIAQGGNGR